MIYVESMLLIIVVCLTIQIFNYRRIFKVMKEERVFYLQVIWSLSKTMKKENNMASCHGERR